MSSFLTYPDRKCWLIVDAVDAYRNKMRSTMLAAGQDPAEIPQHLETRPGKRRFLGREKRKAPGIGSDPVMSASKRSAEEVEP